MKYTTGDWSFRKDKEGKIRFVVAWANECIPIAEVCNNNEANAHLIVAAPDMYEALKLYQNLYQKYLNGTQGHYCRQCVEAINKALAKAEGKHEPVIT